MALWRLFPNAAGLAALFFALEDGHGLAAGWLANRNALISGVFGILTLIMHDRWRREGWKARMALAPAVAPLRVARIDAKTLVIRAEGGFLGASFDNVFRGSSHPLKAGSRVKLTGVTVEIASVTGDGRAADVASQFSVPLEDASLRWIRWEGKGYVPFELPPTGKSIVLPPAPPFFE